MLMRLEGPRCREAVYAAVEKLLTDGNDGFLARSAAWVRGVFAP